MKHVTSADHAITCFLALFACRRLKAHLIPGTQPRMRLRTALWIAFGLRVVLLLWGSYQDSTSAIKYTDIDYVVFTDASRCLVHPLTTPGCTLASGPLVNDDDHPRLPMLSGWIGDPYSRKTYRYTPLLALLTCLNILVHPIAAKLVFVLSDLLIGTLLHSLLVLRHIPSSKATQYVSYVWLFNPIIANISTRGSSEAVLGVLLIATLFWAEKNKWFKTAVMLGLSVHFKIYPVIYASSMLGYIASNDRSSGYRGWFGRKQWLFALTSAATFMLFNLAMYLIYFTHSWGEPFISHTFLYHLHRLDHRHNFSPYFYSYYLSSSSNSLPTSSKLLSLIRHPLVAFIPQLGSSIALGFFLSSSSSSSSSSSGSSSSSSASDLPFIWLIQTLVFVTFNKVCTSQYFLWYIWFLPLVLPDLNRITTTSTKSTSPNQATAQQRFILLSSTMGWVLAQVLWLSQAYQLEILGWPTYLRVWAAGVAFLGINCWLIVSLIKAYSSPSPTSTTTTMTTKAKSSKLE
ncbi:BQ2448_6276 [Microbotryum intermedium]|uniref:GPI mannosyltransferase 1 n=1 Tax=Microbotryum intermedium TaxID=269621 RepID=A0A238FRW5_9BASI|nr:BQ2448_6276 [Microbotryum intermedium]